MNDGEWSAPDSRTEHTFTSLADGSYRFEARSIDQDGNRSQNLAIHAFVVEPPLWKNPWIVGASLVMLGLVGLQTGRVIRRDRFLNQANLDLEEKSKTIQENTERKSAFLASMAHELRTPMNAIKGFSSLVARREKGLSERGRENLQKVDRASDHLLAMINDLLDLSKIEAARMDVDAFTFDIRQVVVTTCDIVRPSCRKASNFAR